MGSTIGLHITDRCQLNCDHCLRDPGLKAVDLELDLIRSILTQAAEHGVDRVSLTGGEPTLHPDFFAIVDTVAELGMKWNMISNGHTFERVAIELARVPHRLEALSRICLSLDGATEATHDAIRGDGNFRSVMSAVSLCEIYGLPFQLQMTIHARNEHEVEQLALLAAQLGAVKVSYALAQPTATFLDRNLYLSPARAALVAERVRRLRGAFSMEIGVGDMFSLDAPFMMCGAWRYDLFHVDVEGFLTVCCQHSGIPSAGSDVPLDRVADLRSVSFGDARKQLIDKVASVMKRRVDFISSGSTDPWMTSQCNWCLKEHGKPHWSDDGVAGPQAARERWRGAWAPGYKPSHVDAGANGEPEKP